MQTEFHITGMHCGSCAVDIKETLEELDGVRHAQVNFANGAAQVEYDEDKLSPDKIVATISELGYQAQEHKAQERIAAHKDT